MSNYSSEKIVKAIHAKLRERFPVELTYGYSQIESFR